MTKGKASKSRTSKAQPVRGGKDKFPVSKEKRLNDLYLRISIVVAVTVLLTFVLDLPVKFRSSINALRNTSTPTFTVTPSPTPSITFSPSATFTPSLTLSPTSTSTPSPIPTLTFTPTLNPVVFRGLDKNCIEEKHWRVTVFTNEKYPSTFNKNSKICLDLSSKGVSAQNEGLRINVSTIVSEVFSLSTELPKGKDVDIHLKIRLDLFTTETQSIDNVLALGVGKSTDYYLANGNYVLFSIRAAYKTNDIHTEIGDGILKAFYDLGSLDLPTNEIDILFSIRGIDLFVYIDGEMSNYYPRSLSEQGSRDVFWIGYHLRAYKSALQAQISDFTIIEK